jgi:DNA excision repair protein ERCC-2
VAERDYLRFFPYDEPYPSQAAAMDQIHAALERGRDVLFEGACGTGKTLAALAPALEYGRRTGKAVVITTNVHQQMRQFVSEARAITETEPIRSVVFRGKASMCHIDVGYEECRALRETTRDLVEAERDERDLERRERRLTDRMRDGGATGGDSGSDAGEARQAVMDELSAVEQEVEALRERATCEHFYNNLRTDPRAFESWLFADVRTPDEVYAHAHEGTLCGYELLKDAMEGVDLVVCNYHHLLDPEIRQQFFRWLGRDPEDVIAVFDEAHNIERAAREHATRTLSERTLDGALDELRDVEDVRADAAANVLRAFRDALVSVYEDDLGFGGRERIDENWEDVVVHNEDGRDDLALAFLSEYTGRGYDTDLEDGLALGRALDERYETAYKNGKTSTRRECQTLAAAAFIGSYLAEGTQLGQYPVVSVRRHEATGEVYGRAELYACIPRDVTRSLFESNHASVLMSATLRPFDVTADVLGMDDPATMAYGLSFPRGNRRTFAVASPPLFSRSRDDRRVQVIVTRVLEDAMRYSPGNTLVFFPSYGEADRYAELVETPGGLYLDEAGTPVEDLRKRFVEDENAALFTSLWGTLTEGVSFDGQDARTVVVVGVPYPYLDDRLEAVQRAYDETFRGANAGWEYAVEIPTVRKTRQALGRALRSPEEVGARVLVDSRYTEADMGRYSVRDTFPPEERAELIDVEPDRLKFALLNFYSEHDAWDGSPPAP